VVLFFISWKLTLAVLATMPPFFLATLIHTKLAKTYEKITQQYQADATCIADEIISGIIPVKSFCSEIKELARFDKTLEKFIKLSYRRGVNNA